VITVKRSLDSIAIGKFIFTEKRINECFLMDPKLTSIQVLLKLYAQKDMKWSQVLDTKSFLDLSFDKIQECL
jgi:hypothetical protein